MKTLLKTSLAIATLTFASTSVFAAPNGVGGVTPQAEAAWNQMMPGMGNHLMNAGQTISATGSTDQVAFTGNSGLDMAAWGHKGTWYTFMSHGYDTKISVTADDANALSPGFTVWRSTSEWTGGSANAGDGQSSSGTPTPHSFNQTGQIGDLGTLWMTDTAATMSDGLGGSIANPNVGNGLVETLGYANSGPAQAINGWGNVVNTGVNDLSSGSYNTGLTGTTGAGYAEMTLSDLSMGWYTIFIGGTEGTNNVRSTFSLNVSAVPVPAAVYLFGSALVGLFATGRRKLAA